MHTRVPNIKQSLLENTDFHFGTLGVLNTEVYLFHERTVFRVFSAMSSADQWSTIELPVNKTVQACILEITNANLFYALPNEIAGKKV